MAMKEDKNKIPVKFRNIKKSFMDTISLNNNYSFMSFPKELNFHGKEKGEQVVLIIRSHWIVTVPYFFLAILVFILPFILASLMPTFFSSIALLISLVIISLLVSLGIVVSTFVKWFYTVHIITDQKVVDLDFTSIMNHSMAEAQLERIEDVTHKQLGAIGSIFDVGSVYIQTAGAQNEIEFTNVPRPRDVQDILFDLLELKQKGEI
ncbi:MAG TPA: PH domain-containing protein [Candidatus Dojkabacteria bacterium]|nr:PH domain-containing protein [Candidatus Dojkabacteria bacterium]